MEAVTPYQKGCLRALRDNAIRKDRPRGNPNFYLSIDPGEGTGWALFGENGQPTNFGNVYGDVNGITDLLWGIGGAELFAEGRPQVVIYEDFLNRKKFLGSRNLTSQVIGVVRAFARINAIQIVRQESSANPFAEQQSGITPEGPHSTQHWVMAFNHGWHYLSKRGIVIPRVAWADQEI